MKIYEKPQVDVKNYYAIEDIMNSGLSGWLEDQSLVNGDAAITTYYTLES